MEYGVHENKWASLAELRAVRHLSQQMELLQFGRYGPPYVLQGNAEADRP